jgi:predicted O-methyltransferase YrrM
MADSDSRAGTVHFTREIREWTAALHAPHDAALQAAFDAPAREGLPAIQIAPAEGKLLELLLRLSGARRVLELGTLAGYSAIHLARALPPDGKVWTVELEPHHAEVARRSIDRAGLSSKIEVVVGSALEVLPTLERFGPFCAVFVDADKENYDHYGRWAARNVRPGGLLLGDNAFLFGELLDEDPRSEAMRRFHADARAAFDTVCIPTPDGLLVGIHR